jgi:hypothetical protein
VLIGGEAGIGKTTLAEATLREAARRGFAVLEGHCFDLAETPPYGPFIDLFLHLPTAATLPPLPPAFAQRGTVGAVSGQMVLFAQMLDFLTALAQRHPVVVLLDDLHWADAASLDLLRFLSRSVAALPLVILATYRSDELTRKHPLSPLLPQLARDSGAERIDLGRLDDAAVRTLILERYGVSADNVGRLAAYLQGRADGNALFVGELLRALEEGGTLRREAGGWALGALDALSVPPLLRQVIEGRVARLDEESQRLLTVAAVIGHDVPLVVWAMAGETDEEALLDLAERAEEARLFAAESDGTSVRFAHALIREALYEGIPGIRRRRVHRRAGEALVVLPNPDPDAVAYHFERAGDDRAAGWLVRAGERALASYAYATAEDRFGQALPALAGVGRAIALLYLSHLHRIDEGSIPEAEEAMHIATEAGDLALAALARMSVGISLAFQGEIGRGIAELTAAGAALDMLPESTLARYAHLAFATTFSPADRRNALASAYALGGWNAEAMATLGCTLDDALAHLDTLPPQAWSSVGWVCSALGRGRDAWDAITRNRAFKIAREDWATVAGSSVDLLHEAYTPYFADDLTKRAHLVATMDGALGQIVAQGGMPSWAQGRWPLLALEGQWAEARTRWAEARTEGVTFRAYAAPSLSLIARAQGEPELAWRLVRAALPDGPATAPGTTHFMPMTEMQRLATALALDTGDLDIAHQWLEMHDRWLAWSGAVRGLSEGQALRAQYHRQAGDREQAHAHAERALAHATEPRQPLALLAAHRLRGELDIETGRYADAARHLDASLTLADACQAPYERALTLLAMAELKAATGESDAARTLLDEVATIGAPLGATPMLARANKLGARLTQA